MQFSVVSFSEATFLWINGRFEIVLFVTAFKTANKIPFVNIALEMEAELSQRCTVS